MAKVVKTGGTGRKPVASDTTFTRRTTPLRGSDQRSSGYDRRSPAGKQSGNREK